MLISRVEEGAGERAEAAKREDHSHEYQTASELFDLMAKNHPYDHEYDSLSARDLVILYKNIELGTKLMNDADELKRRRPNQHVETVVFNDEAESEGSDSCEAYSSDDLHDVFLLNDERINLLSGPPSLENTLCHKFADVEIRPSNISTPYDKYFLFKDPYIKEQLKSINLSPTNPNEFDGSVLPASLLDYICCKRLEDNYNFYMDNIIRYVKHTIEQLKRISNGDYLTDKAKEKWKEVENTSEDYDNTKVLATSTSIPLQVERKTNGCTTKWDDLIHSEVDVRSLSKILEKKIIVEIPKLICGSYKLFSKLCSDNLIISCQKEQPQEAEDKESRVDVVLQLGRSDTGHVISNINSIMILQTNPPSQPENKIPIAIVPYQDVDKEKSEQKIVEIVEIKEVGEVTKSHDTESEIENNEDSEVINGSLDFHDDSHYIEDDDSKNDSYIESCDSKLALRDILDKKAVGKPIPFLFVTPDELAVSVHKSFMGCVPEEKDEDSLQNQLCKKKSPTKVRIKSPYENKSHIMEEKKRKRLLEIREKREKKKIALSENCKISKHKYGKGAVMPQPSSSVTKLSITNKSFYNSIYGQNMNNVDVQSSKGKGRKGKKDLAFEPSLDHVEGEHEASTVTPNINSKKYIDRSYYLDEAETEMMYTQQSECSSGVRDLFSTSTSVVSNDFCANLPLQMIESPVSSMKIKNRETNQNMERFSEIEESEQELPIQDNVTGNESCSKILTSSRSITNEAPEDVPNNNELDKKDLRKPSVECRKSIDKIYDLMKKLGNTDSLEIKSSRSKFTANNNLLDPQFGPENSIIQYSDSGTSVKHHSASSNPSCFSFEKPSNPEDNNATKGSSNKMTGTLTTIVPKVIISTKQQTSKPEGERPKKDRKKNLSPPPKVSDNPLKAISQLLHEFDSVQKTRQKMPADVKTNKRPEISVEGRIVPKPTSKRRSRSDQTMKDSDLQMDRNKVAINKERRLRPTPMAELLKAPHQQMPVEDRQVDRITKRRIADFIDEVKEAKGEAVRGPKLNSRLNSLAQPKKTYVLAHSEEYHTKYGKNLMADRLHRLASTAAPGPGPAGERPQGSAGSRQRPQGSAGSRQRPRRLHVDAAPPGPVRSPQPTPLESGPKVRRPGGSPPAPAARRAHASDAPETFQNKMVAVESYVKNHYGHRSSPVGSELLGVAHTARVPLVPQDLDISERSSNSLPVSADESTVIGSKLHTIINSMINSRPTTLAALEEGYERTSKQSNESFLENLARHDAHSSIESEYRNDLFQDKNVRTAVETVQAKREETVDEICVNLNDNISDEETCDANNELEKLESAIHRRLSVGAFPKRLRLKNLTLTPKQSMQQMFLLQSGDAGSVILRSTTSNSLKLSSSDDLKILPSLTRHSLDWKYTEIPLQIATVGYAFPSYNARGGPAAAVTGLSSVCKALSVTNTSNEEKNLNKHLGENYSSKTTKRDVQAYAESSDINKATMVALSTIQEKKQMATTSITTDIIFESFSADKKAVEHKELSTVITKSVDNTTHHNIIERLDNVDCTSSLDMLVGLLNEIQKITTCHMTDTKNYCNDAHCNELENILNNNAALGETVKKHKSHELVTLTQLNQLKQLESSCSIYSLNISNDEHEVNENSELPKLVTSAKSVLCNEKPICIDKEVNVEFPEREYISTLTDVPSSFFPITITHSTNVSKSLIGILSKPSNHSVLSLEEQEVCQTNLSVNSHNKIIEITKIPSKKHISKISMSSDKETVLKRNKIVNKILQEVPKTKIDVYATNNQVLNKKCSVKQPDSDAIATIKMKRDILVTMYSMLVLTIFAALSFQDVLYRA